MDPFRPIPEPLQRPIRLVALISGGGTTLLNFLEKIEAGELSAEVPLVIASRSDCSGIAKCQRAGLRCEVVARKSYSDTASFSRAIFDLCRSVQADLVTLAGFLSLIEVPDDFASRVMNIHPALIPAFCGQGMYGHKVHEAVLTRGAKVSGCTVHFADNRYDHGPIILQRCVPVEEGDSPDTLAARVFTAECTAYPEAIRLFAAGRLQIADGRVNVLRPHDSYKLPIEIPPAITLQLLNETPDEKLHDLMFNYVQDYLCIKCRDDSWEDKFQRIPEGLRMIWHLVMLDSEVCNGGFAQFFCNEAGTKYSQETLAALETMDDDERIDLLKSGLNINAEELKFHESGEQPTEQKAAEFRQEFDRLDNSYYQLSYAAQSAKVASYARKNPEKFLHSPAK
jgi:formyltetrahydrofolate-dependent phosphoribosylglycinamide formyltransferase